MTDQAQVQHFQWSGIDAQNKRVNGMLDATDLKSAQTELKKKGIEVISLKEKPLAGLSNMKFFSKKKKIKPKEILLFTRYLSSMLTAGLSIIQALDIIGKDQENPAMQSLIATLKNNIAGGKTLADTFSLYPKQFDNLYCNLIRTGEKSGTLDKILKRLAHYMERTELLKKKIKKALIYPAAIVSVAIIVSGVLLIFVVPQFQTMFKSFGAELPFFTQMIVNLSQFLRTYWWLLLGGALAGGWWLKYLLQHSEIVQEKIDKWSLKIKIIGPILRKGIIARYTRTLATTLESGMPIVDAMKSIAPLMNNRVYEKAVWGICNDITTGHALSASMDSTKLFPNMVIQMISVGEASGSLSDMLNKVADYYEDEVNSIVDNLSSLLEPLIMLILGAVVGTFLVAMYLPIFQIGSLF